MAEWGQHPFTEVDAQSDPAAWVGVLDRLRRDPAYATYKARVRELVDAQAAGRYLDLGCGTGTDARNSRRGIAARSWAWTRRGR